MSNLKKRVVIGLSGGVDSSVSAALLKQQGYDVLGVFMKNWEATLPDGSCPAEKDFQDVQAVCDVLDIPVYSFNFAEEYREQVFAQFLADLNEGLTPNPDILCNRSIKFNVLWEQARRLGATYLATGHYAQLKDGRLFKGLDPAKDQSYFLSAVNGRDLKNVLFPVGHLKKTEVRRLAHEMKLPTAEKKDSVGICFVGKTNFQPFVAQYITPKSGDFKTLAGEKVGDHLGASFYTLGQRKGLGLGGPGEPWFVVKKDIDKNTVFVERGEYHPALYTKTLETKAAHWIHPIADILRNPPVSLHAKIRYRQSDQKCTVTISNDLTLKVEFQKPQRASTPGQTCAFYLGDECLGSATIKSTGPTYHDQGFTASDLRSLGTGN